MLDWDAHTLMMVFALGWIGHLLWGIRAELKSIRYMMNMDRGIKPD